MREGRESWGCSAWGREGSGDTLEQLPVPGGAARELERDFLMEPVKIGQGVMVLN